MIISRNNREIWISDPNQNFTNVRNLTRHTCYVDTYIEIQNGLLTCCFGF